MILPRIRFHKTISEACSQLTVSHALKHPMLLYAVVCRASIEPRPEDGNPQDGGRMHQASISRAGRRESINFKLHAIKHLNKQISSTRQADDHFPILHTISFLLRIEVSPGPLNPRHESSNEDFRLTSPSWRLSMAMSSSFALICPACSNCEL